MLISRVSEGEGRDAGEYRTADELFELMAKDRSYETGDNQSLSTRDLIILYKNIDVGTKLMSSANVGQSKAPNQHVETVVYKDDRESDDSDVSEIYSNEDLQDVFSINNERIDLINNLSSIQHPLCHKFGDIEFQSSNFSEYDSHFLFKDPYIKQQLKNINILPDCTEFDTILPSTLLDYICCKRLEDNYNFYMDNIIRYVQHTIEQLKRISNGDYLTDRAREKWREVAKDLVIPSSDTSKVLATSVSIPIHVMGKVDGHISTWDDIVHSAVDVRSLSKILEKKIIIEVPKLICGSYKLFSERCADNLIISCKKDIKHDVDQDKGESRVDVVFQLEPAGSGHVISNINSIMILQKMPSITTAEPSGKQHTELAFKNYDDSLEDCPKIIEIDGGDHKEELKPVNVNSNDGSGPLSITIKKSLTDTSDCSVINNYLSSNISNIVDKGLLNKKVFMRTLKTETDFAVISPDELRCAIRRLNMQTPVPEESEEPAISKKKSPTRVRIKSPYENQSYSIEEKKRKKLLEIREKREKKKVALSENCKVSKYKFLKSAVMAQPSSSVTKLSITNKSFYNSIYGDNVNQEGGTSKKSRKSQKKDIFEHPRKDECELAFYKSAVNALDRNYFDDENTETIMQLQPHVDTEAYSTPISAITNNSSDVNLLSQLIGSSGIDYTCNIISSSIKKRNGYEDNGQDVPEDIKDMANLDTSHSSCIIVPANTPKERGSPSKMQGGIRKATTSVECRKSIDKIYDLLKKIENHDDNEITSSVTQHVLHKTDDLIIDGGRSSTIQVSDSGTSVKHHAVSSNPSTFSFEKNNNLNTHVYKDRKKKDAPATVVPKVIISTKLQTAKIDDEWTKSDRKRVITNPSSKASENPLKAISQLLNEFNNVQKSRHKTNKKDDHIVADAKALSRQGSSKKRQEPPNRDIGMVPLKTLSYKERRARPGIPQDPAQFSSQLSYLDDKHTGRLSRRNLNDIIDEAKEARGEAVRGPPKPYSRINTLAQPKKSYVQAHNDEYQNKYARNITAHRLNRVTTSAPLVEKTAPNTNNARNKRKGPEIPPVTAPKPGISAVPPLERILRPRRSASNSPTRKRISPQPPKEPSFRPTVAPKSPDLKKKMVAVESYVKSHYGHKPIDTSELKGQEVHKSRVPLVPNDIELASLSSPIAEESTALGNQLHYMVDTMINTNVPPLSILAECQETVSKLSDGLEKLSTESLLKHDERKSESDYPVDIFEDKNILTAVASIPKGKQQEHKAIDIVDTFDVQSFNSATEIRKLENALYQQMSVGAFPKRLRIKNLTLTPKQSLQQVIVVQSGDAGSMLVKSSLSQSFGSDCKTDSLTALKPLTALSNTNINWGFTNIPMQVATIGYAFPTFESYQRNGLTRCVQALTEKPSNEDVNKDVCKSHKTSQCFKGVHTESSIEQATQANIVLSITSTCNINMDTSTEQKEIIINESQTAKNGENVQPITTICERIRLLSEKYEIQQPITGGSQIQQKMADKYKKIQTIKERRKNIQHCEQIQGILEKREKTQTTTDQSEILPSITEQGDKNKDMTTSKTTLNIGIDINDGEVETKASEIVDHSTSLDILMGLLNEIRKITGEANTRNDTERESNSQSQELEIILNNAATRESSIDNNCRDLVSVSSLEKCNKLDSNPSTSSLNMLKQINKIEINDETKAIFDIVKDSPISSYKVRSVDKEVTVDIEKQYVNKLTDVPSCFFPFTINHDISNSDSVIEMLSEPSTLSVYSIAKYETLDCNSILSDAFEEPKAENAEVLSTIGNTMAAQYFNILDDKTDEKNSKEFAREETKAVVSSRYKHTSKVLTSTACVAMGSNFDPLLQMKRDILVTVYSILVFTVFAALSFPKVFFHMEM